MARHFEKKTPFKSGKYRAIVMGIDISVVVTQVMVFLLLQQNTKNGELPFYVTDLVIVLVAAVVAILAPFISWIGSVNRRRTKFICGCISAGCLFVFFFMPMTATPGSEYCAVSTDLSVNKASTGVLSARLALLIASAFTISLSGVALWNHGIAYMYENNPKINTQLGILIVVKFVTLSLAYLLVKDLTLGSMLWIQAIGILVGLAVNLPGLLCSPEEVQRVSDDQQGFLTSMGRVLSNGLAMLLIITMSLFSAGLWGFSYNNLEILRTKYLFQEPKDIGYTFSNTLSLYFIIGIVGFYCSSVTKSLPALFDRIGTLKTILKCLVFIAIIYIPQGLTHCERGNVAGLSSLSYSPPSCGSRCGCSNPTVALNPVCVVDEMATYLSPCHAGCTGVENFTGISVFANCTCSGNLQRATRGACNAISCNNMVALHNVLFMCILIFGAIILKNHIVMILEAVDIRDKSVALGIATSFLYVFTFVCGQIGYFLIGESTCLWSTNGICQIHKEKFSLYVSMTSLGLTVTAAVLTILTIVALKRRMISS